MMSASCPSGRAVHPKHFTTRVALRDMAIVAAASVMKRSLGVGLEKEGAGADSSTTRLMATCKGRPRVQAKMVKASTQCMGTGRYHQLHQMVTCSKNELAGMQRHKDSESYEG